jgi:hypothetical protein
MATLYVCRKCKHSKCLQKAVERDSDVSIRLVGCQDVCEQPVAGTRVDGRLEWFGGLDKAKRQRALVEMLNSGSRRIPDELAKARVGKRAGKGPR